jgi:hypothetical protein
MSNETDTHATKIMKSFNGLCKQRMILRDLDIVEVLTSLVSDVGTN